MRGWGDEPVGRLAVAACGIRYGCARPFVLATIKPRRSPKNEISASLYLFGETLGEFNQNAPIGRVLDFSKGNDEPQPFDNIQVDFIVAKQLQQLVPGVIGIVDVHRRCSGRR
jgi:hypothetical protein